MPYEAKVLVLKIREATPGAIMSFLGKLTDFATWLDRKFQVFGSKVNYVELMGNELRIGYSEEVAATSTSIAFAIVAIIIAALATLGIVVYSWSIISVAGKEKEEELTKQKLLDMCRELNYSPEQCTELMAVASPVLEKECKFPDICWWDWKKILGAGAAVAGGLLLVRALWPER